jgi:glycosyltransferase involved in cell wall biosynthesis
MGSTLKVLIINNVASMQAITANALNKIDQVEATNIAFGSHKYISSFPCSIELKSINKKDNIFLYLYYKIVSIFKVYQYIKKSSIVHYVWTPILPFSLDLYFCKFLNKKIFVEFVGSEIRKPHFLSSINKYYKKVFNAEYEYYELEKNNEIEKVQKIYSQFNATPTVCPEISLFINKNLFSKSYSYMQRINSGDFLPNYPSKNKTKPLIIHSPSAKIAKGSNYIIPIIEELKSEYDFDFKLLHNISRMEVLEIMKDADIFLDQIILGSYGLASCEAMAFGKPVMCYIMPEVFEAGLSINCPIINSNPDNLKENLIKLITNPELRHQIGIESRKFIEKYHNADTIAKELVELYKKELTS